MLISWMAGALLSAAVADTPGRVEYCASTVFRETPFADIRCARPLAPDTIGARKHFRMHYDSQGRLTELRFQQNGETRPHYGRFVRAPRIVISYSDDLEVRRFYDEYGARTQVSGNVYESRFEHDAHGQRRTLTFAGLDGQPVEDHFGIARYEWTVDEMGNVTEHRYDLDGEITRNRPGFGYLVTRFAYDAQGLLRRMTNLGEDGMAPTPDEAGIVHTEIRYDRLGHFIRWTNLDGDGEPRRGMSGIAEIRYQPGDYAPEADAAFIDADGNPQSTRWGAHRVAYTFDAYGNTITRRYFGEDGTPVAVGHGVSIERVEWTEDGARMTRERFFSETGAPVEGRAQGIHEIRYTQPDDRRHITSFHDLEGEIINHPRLSYARDVEIFDTQGRRIGRRFENQDGALVDHGVWGVARFEYVYSDQNDLLAVNRYSADGTARVAEWDPVH